MTTRKGTRVAMLEAVPMLGDPTHGEWPEIPQGAEGTVVEDTNTLAYSVVFDDLKMYVFTVGAHQVRVLSEPPTYEQLQAALNLAIEGLEEIAEWWSKDDQTYFELPGIAGEHLKKVREALKGDR